MRYKKVRFFGCLLSLQEKWLNRMSQQGYHLINTSRAIYEFETCTPGEYQYKIDYIGHRSRESSDKYVEFLQSLGYVVFFKNINLNYSLAKVQFRPWAESGGKLSTPKTTLNKELLIVEKKNDGKPFELYTTLDDKLALYKSAQSPWIFFFFIFMIMAVLMKSFIYSSLAITCLIIVIVYWFPIYKIIKERRTRED